MPRIKQITDAEASNWMKKLFGKVEAGLGVMPTLFRCMANSESIFEGFLGLNGSFANAKIDPKYSKMVILRTSQLNHCEYCVCAHTQMAKDAKLLDDEQCLNARKGIGIDDKSTYMLKFVDKIHKTAGFVSDEELAEMKKHGFNDGEIVEIIGAMSLATMTNYLSHVGEPDIDFPKVPEV